MYCFKNKIEILNEFEVTPETNGTITFESSSENYTININIGKTLVGMFIILNNTNKILIGYDTSIDTKNYKKLFETISYYISIKD